MTRDKRKCPLSVLTGFRIMAVNFRENDAERTELTRISPAALINFLLQKMRRSFEDDAKYYGYTA